MPKANIKSYEEIRRAYFGVVQKLNEETGFTINDLPDVRLVHGAVAAGHIELIETGSLDKASDLIRFTLAQAAGIRTEDGQHTAA